MAQLLNEEDVRTARCGEFSAKDIGREVCVMGWAQRRRDLAR